jgi:PTH2 family peptidyl-tRNA hydrolase
MSEIKQVIVWRSDVRTAGGQKLRSGKIAAQASHASVGAIFSSAKKEKGKIIIDTIGLESWYFGQFTKICLQCANEKELDELYEKAQQAGLPCALITDAGHTEFAGIPTKTCLGIGPGKSEEIDKLTKHLSLY